MNNKTFIDKNILYEELLKRAKRVLQWPWYDIDAEPARDLKLMAEAIDDIEDLKRLQITQEFREKRTRKRGKSTLNRIEDITHSTIRGHK